MWLFWHTSDCRIFQHRTTQQILETIFGEAGIRDYDFGPVTGPKKNCADTASSTTRPT